LHTLQNNRFPAGYYEHTTASHTSVGTPASAEEDISDKYSNPNILSYSTLDSMPFERNTLEKTHFVLSKYASMSTTAWQPPRAAENESQRPHQAPTN
jgi:hypothetical protein